MANVGFPGEELAVLVAALGPLALLHLLHRKPEPINPRLNDVNITSIAAGERPLSTQASNAIAHSLYSTQSQNDRIYVHGAIQDRSI